MLNLDRMNSWSEVEARAAFLRCCGATRWAERMTTRRPFASEAELLATAEQIWQSLAAEDWLEALSAHPRIGDLESLRSKFTPTAATTSKSRRAGTCSPACTGISAIAGGSREASWSPSGRLTRLRASGNSPALCAFNQPAARAAIQDHSSADLDAQLTLRLPGTHHMRREDGTGQSVRWQTTHAQQNAIRSR